MALKYKPEFVRAPKGGKLPQQMAFLAVESAREKRDNTESVTRHNLFRGSLITVKLNGQEFRSKRAFHFTEADDLWQRLRAFAKSGTTTYLMSHGTRDVAGVLGFWQMHLTGKARLHGNDPSAAQNGSRPGYPPSSGYCVLSDPPTIIQFKLDVDGGIVKWIDAKNYGIEDMDDLRDEYFASNGSCNARHKWLDEDMADAAGDAACLAYFGAGLVEAVSSLNLGSFQQTAGSQALHGFKSNYMHHTINLHHNEVTAAFEREALHGGRCECRFLGRVLSTKAQASILRVDAPTMRIAVADGPITQFDVNSLYPAVARNAELPSKHVFTNYGGMTPDELDQVMASYCVVARVLVETDEPCVPCRLAKGRDFYRIKDKGWDGACKDVDTLTIYPRGRFWTTLCGPEIDLVRSEGEIVGVGRVEAYTPAKLFQSWVETLWAARQYYDGGGKASVARTIKRIMVALFGKWSQRDRGWLPVPDRIAPDAFAQWWQLNPATGREEQWRSFCYCVERMVERGEHPESFPAITAHVNSLGRLLHWQLIRAAGKGETFYYDTDSLWTTARGAANLAAAGTVDANELGKLKIVGVYNDVTFDGIKSYNADGRKVKAGIPKAREVGDDGRAFAEVSLPTEYYLRRREAPACDTVRVYPEGKNPYRHGRVDAAGFVTPWEIFDGPDETGVDTPRKGV